MRPAYSPSTPSGWNCSGSHQSRQKSLKRRTRRSRHVRAIEATKLASERLRRLPAAARVDRPAPVIAPRGPPHLGGTTLGTRQAINISSGDRPQLGARMTTSVQQHRALRLLADAPHGRTVADMLAYGFTNALLDRLARDGLATIQPGTICTSTRRITVVWVAINEAGKRALAAKRLVE
jgi:hypothetical protein